MRGWRLMPQEQETVYLVDGSSYIHRAYHAIRNLSNSKGLPTNAVLGFAKMTLKLMQEKSPAYMLIAFDAKGPTFRHDLYKAYKANRPPMPEDLQVQIPYIRAFVKAMNVAMIEKEGYEADDVIGTLARLGEEKNYRIVIITGDKDFRQLLSQKISLWDTMKDRITDLDRFHEEYGLEPDQVIDLMGLSGDTSDNIPGVPGVGEITALKLIRQFKTLENVFDHVEEVKGKKLQENLAKSRDKAVLSKKLVTIDRYVPIEKEIDDFKTGDPDADALSKMFHELEFRGLWDRFASRKEAGDKVYHLCLSREELLAIIEEIKKRKLVSLDTETTSSDPLKAELVGISFSLADDKAYYLPLTHRYLGVPNQLSIADALEDLKPVLEDEEIKKIGQNIKYDALVFRTYGVRLKGIYFDTMIASYVINPGLRQHNLDYLAQHYLNHKMITFREVMGKGRSDFSEAGLMG